MKKILALAAFAIVAPVVSVAQEVGRDQEVWTWQGRVDSGKWFTISSVNGPVSVERSSDNLVHVRAEKEVRRGSVTDVAFQVVESGGDVTICALWRDNSCDEDGYRSRRDRGTDSDRRDRRDVKVHFTIRVPAGVKVRAGTVNGEMRVRNASSDVRASTVNGGVEVLDAGGEVRATTVNGAVEVRTTNGPVNASTVNGNINVRMSSIAGDGPMKFNSLNGSIRLEMPQALNADFEIQTMNGSITSDFPMQLTGRIGPRNARVRVGNGGRTIELGTMNGSVTLRSIR